MAFGILSFTGFETAAVLAEETRDPAAPSPGGHRQRARWRAFYVIVTYATSIGYGVAEATTAWPASAAGIAGLADRYTSYLGNWIILAGGSPPCSAGLVSTPPPPARLYVMGRDGVLPRPFGRTHRRHQTPHVAIVVNLGLMVVVGSPSV